MRKGDPDDAVDNEGVVAYYGPFGRYKKYFPSLSAAANGLRGRPGVRSFRWRNVERRLVGRHVFAKSYSKED